MPEFKRFIYGKVCAAALLTGGMLAGCQSSSPPPAYPTAPVTAAPAPVPVQMIPPGATLLSEGVYSSILFKMPDEPGLLYIVDKDTQTVVGQTNAATPGESMTMADLKNVTQPLDSTHKYKIFFVPSAATTKPTAP
jgi:hypothetical protein